MILLVETVDWAQFSRVFALILPLTLEVLCSQQLRLFVINGIARYAVFAINSIEGILSVLLA